MTLTHPAPLSSHSVPFSHPRSLRTPALSSHPVTLARAASLFASYPLAKRMRLPARPAVKRSGTSCPWQDAPSRHSTECLATMGASQQWRAQLSSQPAPASQPKRTRIPATPYALRSDAPPRRPLRSGAPPSRAAQPDAPRPPRAPSGQTPRPPPFDQEPPSVTRAQPAHPPTFSPSNLGIPRPPHASA